MKVLVACEESQVVTKAFREAGHEAFSCDLLPPSGGFPEWHYQCDIRDILNQDWDMMIAHPPCERLTTTANKWYKPEYSDRFPNIHEERKEAIEFFMLLYNADIEKIAIENPVGIMSSKFRKPDQILHPYWFGDPHAKRTCLWLKNLPLLTPTNMVEPSYYVYKSNGKRDPLWHMETSVLPKDERKRARSKTYIGFANAMASQWS